MDIIQQRTHFISSHFTHSSHDGWIIFGYVAFAAVAMAAIYFGAGGPDTSDDALALMVAMP